MEKYWQVSLCVSLMVLGCGPDLESSAPDEPEQVSEEISEVESENALASSNWKECAKEGQRCEFQGTMIVRYGAKDRFFSKTLSGGTQCGNGVFGDPIPGTLKTCSIRSPSSYRIMPLGDSITMSNPGWRGLLGEELKAAGYRFEYAGTQSSSAGKHEGHGGFTIGPDASRYCYAAEPKLACTSSWNLADHIDEWISSTNPNVILLLIGVNDSFPVTRKTGSVGVERPVKAADAPGKLEALVKRILAKKPNAFVFVASLLPTNWSKNINPSLNERARALGERSATDRVFFVDMNQEARLVSGDWSDGLHPNASGNKKVAAVWSRALKSRLPK